jgi:hypothetical protein
MKRSIKVTPSAVDTRAMGHLTQTPFSQTPNERMRLYPVAAVLAYMLSHHASGSQWHHAFGACVRNFPLFDQKDSTEPLITPERSMGFPLSWSTLPLWMS